MLQVNMLRKKHTNNLEPLHDQKHDPDDETYNYEPLVCP